MAFFDPVRRCFTLRLIYDGLGTAGKTTNVRQAHALFTLARSGEVFVPAEERGRTLFFDWLELEAGLVDDHPLRCQVLTVPGQFLYVQRRYELLRSADAIVLVCDSSPSGLERSRYALRFLRRMMVEGSCPDVPVIVQANKQDIPGALKAAELAAELELEPDVPVLEASAVNGDGVRATLVYALQAARNRLRATLEREGPGAVPVKQETPEQVYQHLVRHENDPSGAVLADAVIASFLADEAPVSVEGLGLGGVALPPDEAPEPALAAPDGEGERRAEADERAAASANEDLTPSVATGGEGDEREAAPFEGGEGAGATSGDEGVDRAATREVEIAAGPAAFEDLDRAATIEVDLSARAAAFESEDVDREATIEIEVDLDGFERLAVEGEAEHRSAASNGEGAERAPAPGGDDPERPNVVLAGGGPSRATVTFGGEGDDRPTVVPATLARFQAAAFENEEHDRPTGEGGERPIAASNGADGDRTPASGGARAADDDLLPPLNPPPGSVWPPALGPMVVRQAILALPRGTRLPPLRNDDPHEESELQAGRSWALLTSPSLVFGDEVRARFGLEEMVRARGAAVGLLPPSTVFVVRARGPGGPCRLWAIRPEFAPLFDESVGPPADEARRQEACEHLATVTARAIALAARHGVVMKVSPRRVGLSAGLPVYLGLLHGPEALDASFLEGAIRWIDRPGDPSLAELFGVWLRRALRHHTTPSDLTVIDFVRRLKALRASTEAGARLIEMLTNHL
jgi:signal recognition particle receptor subunit beta